METIMKKCLFLLLFIIPSFSAYSQQGDVFLSSEVRPITASVQAVYQVYNDGDLHLYGLSFPVSLSLPLRQNLGLSILASPVSTDIRGMETLGGLSDAQVALSYYRRLGESSLVISVGANIPSGQKELSMDEYATSIFVSRNFYNFRVLPFGQGFNVSPAITWATPLSEDFILGVGVSYQYRGDFKPVTGMQETFQPGDEVLLTSGIDYRLAPNWVVSADVSYTLYGSDKLGDEEVFRSGNRIITGGQVLGQHGHDTVRLLARYSNRSKSELPAASEVIGAEDIRTVPDQFDLLASYRKRASERVYLTLLGQVRNFNATVYHGGVTLFDLGFVPEMSLSDELTLLVRAAYTLGSFRGAEVGTGLTVNL